MILKKTTKKLLIHKEGSIQQIFYHQKRNKEYIDNKTSKKVNKTISESKVKKKYLAIGSLIVLLIILTPYFFTIYKFFPQKKLLTTFFGEFSVTYFPNIFVFVWTLSGKIIPLYLLIIWFFTCKHWWYHSLLVPIAMYIIQIVEIFHDDGHVDQFDFYFLAPIVLIAAIFLYIVRTKIFDKIHGIDLNELGRVSWKGDLITNTKEAKEDNIIIEGLEDNESEDEDDPLYMG